MASLFAEQNPLHYSASFNTIFTLSGMNEQEIRKKTFLTNAPHDIIARSGGIGDPNISTRDFNIFNNDELIGAEKVQAENQFYEKYGDSIKILARGHDMFVENVNILSTVGPNNERNLANFTKMEFEVHEPYGITLIEKVRAATAINGFVDYQDAPLLLTIEFKGITENGQINRFGPDTYNVGTQSGLEVPGVTGDYKMQGLTRRIPILIVRVDFDVDAGGAKYTVTAVPYADLGFDDRFKFPRTKIPVSARNLFGWVRAVEDALSDQMQNEIDEKRREFADVYKFEVDPDVVTNAQGYETEAKSIHYDTPASYPNQDLDPYTADSITGKKEFDAYAEANSSTALTKFFEDAVRGSTGYSSIVENVWVSYLKSLGYGVDRDTDKDKIRGIMKSKEFADKVAKKPFVPWFKIKSTVHTDVKRFDRITKMHPKTIIYRAMPYQIHVLKFIGAGQTIDADWSDYVRKEYNYLYTGDNLDVQGLRINYKSAYYMRNVRESKGPTETGLWATIKENILEAFSEKKNPGEIKDLRQYPSEIKGRSSTESANPRNRKSQEFFDYLTNPEADMMRIELDILGDPAYICQDIYVPDADQEGPVDPSTKGIDFDQTRKSFNADQFMTCISLNYRLPADINDKEGTMFSGQRSFRDENLFFNGIYQVVKVDSTINQGQFTQTLTCVRMNNQDGQGLPIQLINSSTKGLKEILDESKTQKENENITTKQQHEDLNKRGLEV